MTIQKNYFDKKVFQGMMNFYFFSEKLIVFIGRRSTLIGDMSLKKSIFFTPPMGQFTCKFLKKKKLKKPCILTIIHTISFNLPTLDPNEFFNVAIFQNF